jgi:hypothetical protein
MTIAIRHPMDQRALVEASQEARAMLNMAFVRKLPPRPRGRPSVITPGCMNGYHWLKHEIRLVKELAGQVETAEIAKRLGRTELAVRERIWLLGLSSKVKKIKPPSAASQTKADRVFAALYPSMRRIAVAVSEETGIAMVDLLGHCKRRPVVAARHVMLWTMARDTKLSMAQMGARLELNHSSMIYAIKREDARLGTNIRAMRSPLNRGRPL